MTDSPTPPTATSGESAEQSTDQQPERLPEQSAGQASKQDHEESAESAVEVDNQPADASASDESPDGPVTATGADGRSDESPRSLRAEQLEMLEALLFSTQHPLTPGRLAELIEVDSTGLVRRGVRTLNEAYATQTRAFSIEQVAGGYQMLTLAAHADVIRRLQHKEADAKLTRAAIETLAIIAYKQPILRSDIEAIRGVACGETIRSLMEKHLVRIDGRAELPGRPILYGTTKRFLEVFGLNSLKDLPKGSAELKPPAANVTPIDA